MKKLLFLLLFLPFGLNAQWYIIYGVTNMNDLNQDQLNLALQKSLKTIKTGKTLTFIGAGTGIVGLIIYAKGLNDIVNSTTLTGMDQGLNKGIGGAYMMYGGIILGGIGIPVWIMGSSRKDQIEIALVKFKPTGYIGGIGLKVTF